MKLYDLDYFRTNDNIIFIVKGNCHPKGRVFACPVYWPGKTGERFSQELKIRYEKSVDDIKNTRYFSLYPESRHQYLPQNIPAVDIKNIVEIYRPQEIMDKFRSEMRGTIWWDIYQSMIKVGKINPENIGIFGSYLVGLCNGDKGGLIKDIDFTIYGAGNCHKFKQFHREIKFGCGLCDISIDHVEYEAKKLGQGFNPERNSFRKTLQNKWSSIQVAPGILTTVRFVDRRFGMLNKFSTDKTFCVRGKVVDDFGGSFIPRFFQIESNEGKLYKIITYFWVYHQALKIGEEVEVWGYEYGKNLVILDSINHGIKVL